MEIPDLTNLPLTSIIALLLALAAADVIFAVVVAVAKGNFDAAIVADFLRTHILLRVAPNTALALFGHGFGELIPMIPAAGLAATASLALYAVEVLGSIYQTWKDWATAPKP